MRRRFRFSEVKGSLVKITGLTLSPLCLTSFKDLLDSDWASVRKVLEQADILVIKYSVTDKLAFQQVRNGYAPRLRPLLRHWGVPVILVAVGARLNGEARPVAICRPLLCFCLSLSVNNLLWQDVIG